MFIPRRAAKFLLKDAVESAGDLLLGADVMAARRRLESALQVLRQHGPDSPPHAPERRVRRSSSGKRKTGSLLLPAAIQPDQNNFPHTYMGLEPGTTKEDIRRCLEKWNQGDNGILFYIRARTASSRAADGRSIPASCTRRARS